LQSQGEQANLAKIAFLKAQYGFDLPLWQQYLYWVGGLLHGDMGYSFLYDLPVNKVVGDRLFLTFLVSFTTILFTYVVAFPIGSIRDHQYAISDYLLTFVGFLGWRRRASCWRCSWSISPTSISGSRSAD